MTKNTGLGDNFYCGGYDLSGDVNSINIASPLAVDDLTGIDKFAFERTGLARDGAMEWVAFMNAAAGQAHPVLSALPRTDVVASYFRGTTLGNPVASLVGKQINYDLSRADSGALRLQVQALANAYGLEWGKSLTAGKRTDTAATNGSSIDSAASLSFGAQAYLQVFDAQGTDVTVKIQDSADNSNWTDVSGLAFTALTGASDHTTQRIVISNTSTVRRYIRAITTTSAGFTSLTFAVAISKNEIAGVSF
jgi:hypothetical protein